MGFALLSEKIGYGTYPLCSSLAKAYSPYPAPVKTLLCYPPSPGYMEERAKRAVSKFVDEVVHRLGGQEELRQWLGRWYPIKNRSAIGHWKTGTSDPPAWVLFLISAELDISLDDYAAGESEHSHGRRLDVVEEHLARVLLLLEGERSDRG